MKSTVQPPNDLAIFIRLLENAGKLTPSLARFFLSLGFTEADQARMLDLAEKNQAGESSTEERQELEAYVRAGHLLAALQSKARKTLRTKKVS